MLGRIDVGHSTVVALEVQAARGYHAVQGLEWRTRPTTPGCPGLRLQVGARHGALVLGRTAIAAQRRPWGVHPGGRVGRLSRTGRGQGSGGEAAGPEQRDTLCEKEPTVEQLITRCRLGGDRVRRGTSTFRHVIPPTVSAREIPGSCSCSGAVEPFRRGSWPRGIFQWPGGLAMHAMLCLCMPMPLHHSIGTREYAAGSPGHRAIQCSFAPGYPSLLAAAYADCPIPLLDAYRHL